jgi:hypothetical protein
MPFMVLSTKREIAMSAPVLPALTQASTVLSLTGFLIYYDNQGVN